MKINSSSQFCEKGEMGESERRSWSDLQPDMLTKIGELIKCSYHRQQFRAVCRSWHSSVPTNNNMENRILSSTLPIPIRMEKTGVLCDDTHSPSLLTFLVATTTFVIRPTKGEFKDVASLLTVEEINPGFLTPLYPLSNMVRQPSSRFLNLLETRVSVLAQGWSIRHVRLRPERGTGEYYELEKVQLPLFCAKKVVILSNPLSEDCFSVMMLHCWRRPSIMSLRNGDWDVYDGIASDWYDIAKFKEGKVYAIDHTGQVSLIEYNSKLDQGVRVTTDIVEGTGRLGEKRLVVKKSSSSDEELYMVVRITGTWNLWFSVYKMNEDGKVWEKVRSLGNHMLFVGFKSFDVCFCASLQDFEGLEGSCKESHPGNCVFFRSLVRSVGTGGSASAISQYYLGNEYATGLLEPAYNLMFSPPI